MRRRGFTLMEGLVSMFIMTTGFFAVVGMYPSSVMASLQAGNQMHASQIAQQVLEDARAIDFTTLQPGERDLADQTVSGQVFHVHVTTTTLAADVRQIAVTVRWTGQFEESVSAQTGVFNLEGGTP